MTDFTEPELKIIWKLQGRPPYTIMQIRKPCPTHSVCTPLPLFRAYKMDDARFEAQWNGYHEAGVKQVFSFEDAK